MKMSQSRAFTILVIIFAVMAVGSIVYSSYTTTLESYSSNVRYRVSKLTPQYDYSCLQHIQGMYVVLSNNGTKTVSDLSVSISNPLCKGAVPPLPSSLAPTSALKFYVYSTVTNGTITVSGNNTLLTIKF